MNAVAWQQETSVVEQIRRLQEGFQSPSSVEPVLWALIVILIGTLVVIWVARLQKRVSGEALVNDPRKLFFSILERMTLADEQRQLIEGAAKEAKVRHPAALLLSPTLFDRAAAQWLSRRRKGAPGEGNVVDDRITAETRAILFP